jgi:hypothetical protein
MRLAIMQPYFFPYIGYFQLINSVDKFIFYDDVNFIKNGWINRNRILLNNDTHYITIQLKNASSFKPINTIEFSDNRKKIRKTISQAYHKAPYFHLVFPMIENCLNSQTNMINDQSTASILQIAKYLNINMDFEKSSEVYSGTKPFKKSERIIEICKINGATEYVNPFGGIDLYDKREFEKNGIKLSFLKSLSTEYKQFNNSFISGLSIIDVLMFNTIDETSKLLKNFELI